MSKYFFAEDTDLIGPVVQPQQPSKVRQFSGLKKSIDRNRSYHRTENMFNCSILIIFNMFEVIYTMQRATKIYIILQLIYIQSVSFLLSKHRVIGKMRYGFDMTENGQRKIASVTFLLCILDHRESVALLCAFSFFAGLNFESAFSFFGRT